MKPINVGVTAIVIVLIIFALGQVITICPKGGLHSWDVQEQVIEKSHLLGIIPATIQRTKTCEKCGKVDVKRISGQSLF